MVLPTVTPPPLSPYGTFAGALFQYHNNLVAFESTAIPTNAEPQNLPNNKCILLGGLSDGLIPTPYTKRLEEKCHSLGWSLVQPVLSSSYLGFGSGSLDRDVDELSKLMWYLSCHRSAESFALVGHSTGCQDSVHFLKHGDKEMVAKTKVVALQAPVSDREGSALEPNYSKNLQLAKDLVAQGKAEEMMPRHVFWAPITAQRFLDLQNFNGKDDYFSSDFTDDQLVDRLRHIGSHHKTNLKLLVAFSGSDEYVPKTIDTKVLTDRLVSAMNTNCPRVEGEEKVTVAESLYLPDGNHNLSKGPNDGEVFVEKMGELLKRV